jgi:class 3 adenylate cyclase
MMADELNLLINKDGKPLFYSVYNGKISEIQNETWIDDKDNILNWCFDNNKEVFLNDAPVDYARYFFKPPMMQNNVVVGSVIGVPLNLGSKMIGSIGIVCKSKNVFNNYHLDFSRSIASYVSIAIYNANLYGELGEEKQKSEDLLLNILPGEVATELKQKGKSEAKLYKNVSVLFTDFVSFTSISSKMSPAELVDEIDYCFKIFDEITTRHGLEKIKTIGDAYLAVCGLPNENQNHAIQAINAAHDIRDFIHTPDKYFAKYSSGDGYLMYRNLKKQCSFSSIRIGVNSGPVVAGIVGSRKFAYDIWGDTVNTASRIETLGEAGRVNISGSTYELVKDKFNFIERGKIEAKGKGEIDMYFVEP